MVRIAMLSFWHVHAKDYAREASAHPEVEIAAVWDELPERGRREAAARGVAYYGDIEEVLALPDIDGVVVDTPTVAHRDVMVKAARAGKHIFTEKVLAPSVRECNEILAAVRESGVKLVVSLPRLYTGYTAAIKHAVDDGLLGDITLVRTRLSHEGALRTSESPQGWLPAHFFSAAECGGGAMIDLGCHPMYLARLFAGLPERVSAHYGYITGREVEDNAVVVLEYGNGALGVVEAGFVNPFSPFTVEIHGTEGTLLYGTPEAQLFVRSTRLGSSSGSAWIPQLDVPPDGPTPFQQWIAHIQGDGTPDENLAMAVDLSRLMEAANLSARSGDVVALASLPE